MIKRLNKLKYGVNLNESDSELEDDLEGLSSLGKRYSVSKLQLTLVFVFQTIAFKDSEELFAMMKAVSDDSAKQRELEELEAKQTKILKKKGDTEQCD